MTADFILFVMVKPWLGSYLKTGIVIRILLIFKGVRALQILNQLLTLQILENLKEVTGTFALSGRSLGAILLMMFTILCILRGHQARGPSGAVSAPRWDSGAARFGAGFWVAWGMFQARFRARSGPVLGARRDLPALALLRSSLTAPGHLLRAAARPVPALGPAALRGALQHRLHPLPALHARRLVPHLPPERPGRLRLHHHLPHGLHPHPVLHLPQPRHRRPHRQLQGVAAQGAAGEAADGEATPAGAERGQAAGGEGRSRREKRLLSSYLRLLAAIERAEQQLRARAAIGERVVDAFFQAPEQEPAQP
ncbi:uncharacterized protein [Struthio camelus]|uniref:uncharacterized protein isoform X1 n=1 Tax=Struthio camelus TaxID=8801 RepID=UPI0036041166